MALKDGTMLADDLDEMIEDLPATLVINNGAYSGTASAVTKAKSVNEVGIEVDYDTLMVIPTPTATIYPNQVGKLDGQSVRVNRVEYSPDGVAVTLYMEKIG